MTSKIDQGEITYAFREFLTPPSETWQESESKIKLLVSSHMPEVGTDFVVERAHRVGRTRSDSKPRKIVARFLNYKDREAVYSAANDPRPQMFLRPQVIPKLDRK